jgi:dipeptidyl aminopeptidase/acylaminoacyl peptidase
MAEEKRAITAEDLYQLQIVFDPQISPDGQHVLFCLRRVDRKTEEKYTNLWLVAPQAGEAQQFTRGDQVDRHPRWSPDGRTIAFLSNRQDKKQEQIYLLPFHGGEAQQLTTMRGSFTGFEWSPDGTKLLCEFRKLDAGELARQDDEQVGKLGVVVRRITSLDYKADGGGYLSTEKRHIWTVDVPTGDTRQLSDGPYDEQWPCWSPDGREILFISNRSADPSLEVEATELYLMPAGGGESQLVKAHTGRKYLPAFSPDGQRIAYLGDELPGKFYQNDCLYTVPATGGEARNLTARFDLHLSLATLTDTGSGSPQQPPVWSKDGKWIFCQAALLGRQPLLALPTSGDGYETLVGGDGGVGSYSWDAQQTRLVYLWGQSEMPGEVWYSEPGRGTPRQLTALNRSFVEELDLGVLEEIAFKSYDGEALQGWILKPPGFDPDRRYPSILEIHGGPMMQYGRLFMHEFYTLAAQGFVVYWCNPRGSQGYGEAFAGAIANNWGTVDYDDLMAWADLVAQLPYVDPDRMGVMGGSYGGYMTTLIIGRTRRFKAAVAQRVVSNFTSFYGSSDMNWRTESLVDAPTPPWDGIENYWRMSPISKIGSATTPTLVIHSEQDLRCAQEQGEQVFVALRRLGVESELLLFPEESHGLSRQGRTDRRVARLQHMIRWFEKYVKGE